MAAGSISVSYTHLHDAGAHGFSMGYNYNGKLRSAELLLREDGSVKLIRRAEESLSLIHISLCIRDSIIKDQH